MSTPSGGGRRRGRTHEMPLAEFPAWGLEIMMGLYGPETVRDACTAERAEPGPMAMSGPAGPTAAAGPRAARLDSYDWSGGVVSTPAPAASTPAASTPGTPARTSPSEPVSPLSLQLEAVNELVKYLERKFKRH